jgi:hypothetical protein
MYESRHYVIFSVSELNKIDFDHVLETSADTVRKSVDGTKTFVKWDGVTPECISSLTTVEGTYTHDEMLMILTGPAWTEPGEM